MQRMIGSIRHKGLRLLYEKDDRSKLPPALIDRIEEILASLDVAIDIGDMNLPHYRLHQLSGDRKGQWAVTVRANWRIVFTFEGGHAEDVDFVDYH